VLCVSRSADHEHPGDLEEQKNQLPGFRECSLEYRVVPNRIVAMPELSWIYAPIF